MGNLAQLFVHVLQLCQRAGLVKLGHVVLDGTKVKANASKHKAMNYERMGEGEKKLEAEVQALLQEAARVDAEEDGKYRKGRRGDELPKELARRESRLVLSDIKDRYNIYWGHATGNPHRIDSGRATNFGNLGTIFDDRAAPRAACQVDSGGSRGRYHCGDRPTVGYACGDREPVAGSLCRPAVAGLAGSAALGPTSALRRGGGAPDLGAAGSASSRGL